MTMRLLGLSAVFALVAACLLVTPVAAAPSTVVLQINVTVPLVNKSAVGTFTANVDPSTATGPWSFQGTIGGQFAQASGSGAMSGSGSTVDIKITSIDTWQMPGIARPASGSEGGVHMVGSLAYVSFGPIQGVPASISPPIAFHSPPASGTYIVTNAASGSSEVQRLPMTGYGPATTNSSTVPVRGLLELLGLAAAAVAGAAAVVARRRHGLAV